MFRIDIGFSKYLVDNNPFTIILNFNAVNIGMVRV